jgi:hypothetical protein
LKAFLKKLFGAVRAVFLYLLFLAFLLILRGILLEGIPNFFSFVASPSPADASRSPIKAAILSILLAIFCPLVFGLIFQVVRIKTRLGAENRKLSWYKISPHLRKGQIERKEYTEPVVHTPKKYSMPLEQSGFWPILDRDGHQFEAREMVMVKKVGQEHAQRRVAEPKAHTSLVVSKLCKSSTSSFWPSAGPRWVP